MYESLLLSLPLPLPLPLLPRYRYCVWPVPSFSAGGYNHVTSLLLPSGRGGVSVVKGGVNVGKRGVYLSGPYFICVPVSVYQARFY